MRLLEFLRRKPVKVAYQGKQDHPLDEPDKNDQPGPETVVCEADPCRAGHGVFNVVEYPNTTTGTAATLAVENLPTGWTKLIPVGSVWKRKAPKKEVVKVSRVWYLSSSLSQDLVRRYGEKTYGWTVRAHPLRGGRTLIVDAQWFVDNFDHVLRSWADDEELESDQ